MIHQINRQLLDLTIGSTSKPVGNATRPGDIILIYRRFDSLHTEFQPIMMSVNELTNLTPLFNNAGILYGFDSIFMRSSLKQQICINPVQRRSLFWQFSVQSVIRNSDVNNLDLDNESPNKMFIWIGAAAMVIGMIVWMFI